MQMLDGTISTAASFGISQSSLTGVNTYSLNTMIWANMKQFSLGLNKSEVIFNYDKKIPIYIDDPFTGGKVKFGEFIGKGSIMKVQSVGVNFMYMFGSTVASLTISDVYLGQKDNWWKGFAGGYAFTSSIIRSFGETFSSNSVTLFGTKPLKFKNLDRWTFTPMLATSIPVTIHIPNLKAVPAKNFTYVIGNTTNFALTQRFNANLGISVIGNTDPIIPLTFAAMIGGKFAF